jgi:hypothetical protein
MPYRQAASKKQQYQYSSRKEMRDHRDRGRNASNIKLEHLRNTDLTIGALQELETNSQKEK